MKETPSVKRLRLIKYAPGDAATNMAADEAIFLACQENKSMPTLRFYSWSPPALSIGYGQRISDALDLEKCRSMGITIVRRPTGGRAVLHSGDLSYSLVVPRGASPFNGTIRESYKCASECFARGLKALGIDAEVADKKNGPGPTELRLPASCFSSISAHEICHRGKKLMGSSQKRRNGAILQHGSIFLDVDWGLMAEIMAPGGDVDKAQALSWLKERMTSLREIGATLHSPAQVADALAKGVEERIGAELHEADLAPYEEWLMERLRAEKYSSAQWLGIRV